MSKSFMINLSNCTPFASGSNRHCFIHPGNPKFCIKTIRPENIDRRYERRSWLKKLLGKKRLNDNHQEQAAYQQRVIRQLINTPQEQVLWQHLPKLYWAEPTSLGDANVSELITDSSGAPGQTLEKYLADHGLDAPIQQASQRFSDWLRQTGVLTRNLLPHNLVISDRSGQPELFLIDGLGAPQGQTALMLLPGWRARYIERRLQRFILRIHWELSDRSQSWESAQKL